MKKTSLVKGILLILLSVVLIGSNVTYAASAFDDDFDEIMNGGNTATGGNTTGRSISDNEIDEDDEPLNLTQTKSNTANNTPTEENISKTSNNSSVYKNNTNTNSSLPKTGIEDSIPTMVLIVVFAISAVYAYKKISEYKNV